MKDYSRKHYTDFQFKDWTKNIPNKQIWNEILTRTNGLGEFSRFRGRKTALQAAIAAYLKQSERKKPYRWDQGFISMENNWEGPPKIPFDPYMDHRPDHPWTVDPLDPLPPEIKENLEGRTVFDAEHSGGWCDDDTETITITGTHPIYLLTLTWGTGASIGNISGYGTNLVTCDLTVPSGFTGFATIEASMRSFEGVVGDSNVNVYEGNDCCDITSTITINPVFSAARGWIKTLNLVDGSWDDCRTSPASGVNAYGSSGCWQISANYYGGPPHWHCQRSFNSWYFTTAYNISEAYVRIRTTNINLQNEPNMTIAGYLFTGSTPITVNNFDSYSTQLTETLTVDNSDEGVYHELNFNSAGISHMNTLKPNGYFQMVWMDVTYDYNNVEPTLSDIHHLKIPIQQIKLTC